MHLCDHQAPHPLKEDRGNSASGFSYVLTPALETLGLPDRWAPSPSSLLAVW